MTVGQDDLALDGDGAVYEVGVADTAAAGQRAETGLRGAERVAAGVHRAAVARARVPVTVARCA